jgi:HSP20 family protein
MLPARYDPFIATPFRSLRRDLDRIFEDFFRDVGTPQEIEVMPPRLDLVEKPTGYEILADLPGVDPADIKVSITGNTLRIEGEKREARAEGEPEGRTHVRERMFLRYQRSIDLPEEVDASRVQANLRNGVLRLTIPRSEAAKSRTIEVKVEGKPAKPDIGGEKKKVA